MDIASFVHEGLGNSSYLLDAGDGRAILVDPDRTVGRYLEEAASRGWRIVAILETHLHADFVTGSLEASRATGAEIHVPAEAGAGFAHRGLVPGERLEVGRAEVEALASPGHTPEHLAYVVWRQGDPPALFSGGALIPGGAARTDLIDPRLTEALTRAQFRTLRDAFVRLPDETMVFPTHGGGSFCSVGSGRERTWTLGRERRTNPLLGHEDEEEFVRWFPTTFPGVPAYFSRMRAVNRAGPRLRSTIRMPAPLPPDAFERARGEGGLVVDVRPVGDYSRAHVPGSLSIPFRDAYATWLGWLVPPETPLLFVVDGASLERVVEESLLVGYERFAGFLEGGLGAWSASGRPAVATGLVDAAGAARALEDGAIVIDVREASEVVGGRLPGAVHVPLGELAGRVAELAPGRSAIVYCGHGERASTGISILERAGLGPLLNLWGGFDAWKEGGYRVSG